MSGYKLSALARLDLHAIWDYIAEDNLDAADRVLGDIHAAVMQLVERPEIGHIREDVADTNLRFWRVHSYLIVYHPDTRPLEIIRVLSGFRDFTKLL